MQRLFTAETRRTQRQQRREVEEQIADVRGQIEQMEAEQKNLEHRVDFATIDLRISEEYEAELNRPASSGTQIHNAFVAGLQNLAEMLLGMLLFVEEYGPVLLLWLVILGVPAALVLRKRYRRMLAAAE